MNNRFLSVADLMFILLMAISIGIIFSSPEYRALNINIPSAESGETGNYNEKIRIMVSNTAISVGDKVFKDMDEFEHSFISLSGTREKVVLGIDSDVKYERIAKVLGILYKAGVKSIAFEIRETKDEKSY
jgi:biopolymer transport protein ExbD